MDKLEVTADWIIGVGPDGGGSSKIIAEGMPEDVVKDGGLVGRRAKAEVIRDGFCDRCPP